jgi:uncharacterized repeat protein (TIGR01451 family)
MKKTNVFVLILGIFLSFSSPVFALTCGIPGKDGVGAISASVNTYYPPSGSSTVSGGSTSLSLGTGVGPTALSVGDLLLVIQMQDSSGALEGNFEYAQVASITGGAVTLASGLVNSYAQSFGATTLQTYQVIRVPQYSSATITGTVSPPAWTVNTATGLGSGGVFVIDVAGTLALNGTVNASGKGFRGAFGINGNGNRAGGLFNDANYNPVLTAINGALKGEGTNGVPNQVFSGVAAPVVYTSGLYAPGTAGQAANGNAGGGGNDGDPVAGTNQYNSGGGGGGNAGAGGRGGNSWSLNNLAGGFGGNAVTNSASKIYLGGGGGAGSSNNNTGTNTITSYPPTSPVTNLGLVTTFSGATGPVSSSGASGGGIVILRASNISVAGGSVVANGYDAYSNNGTGSSESSGGGGAGGSVIIQAAASGATIPTSVVGGKGGDANYYDHGPGGGGGGGFVGTFGVTTSNTLTGGANGVDAANGGDNIANSYSALSGTGGSNSSLGTPSGAGAPNVCLPNISVVKSTSTPTITASGATTATYTITATNTSPGFATGADFVDNTLPPGWTFASTGAITFAPALSGTVLGGFVESATPGTPAVAGGPGAVANLAVNGAPAAAPIWSNVTIPGNGAATLTYTVNIPATAPVGVYHNSAGVKYVDPTRSTAGREITANTNNTSNRAGAQVAGTVNTTYQGGSVAATNVLGSNYNGLEAGPAGENITLQADLRVVKTNSGNFVPSGAATGGTYTLTVSNVGRPIQALAYATDQATAASVSSLLGAPYTVTDTLPAGMTLASPPAITGTEAASWACTGVAGDASFTCTRNAAAGNIAAGDVTPVVLATISAPVRVTLAACPGPLDNTAVLSTAAIGESVTTNNTSTSNTIMNCAASLVIAKTDGKTLATSGTSNNYVVTLTNNGPSAADGVVVTDVVGTGLTCPAANAVTCTVLTGGAVCPVGPLTIANLTGAGIAITTLPSTGSVQLTYACTAI